jgi:uncharacterized protein (TIGR00266 family)
MDVKIRGGSAFSFLRVRLSPGEVLTTESGAMASQDAAIELRSKLNGGGILRALLIKFLGKESIFINDFQNISNSEKHIVVSQSMPGEICEAVLNNETLYVQPGAYVASTPGINFSVRWAGFSSFLGGEGLFRLQISGKGRVWYGAYGAVVEKEIVGQYIVDSGHLLSYPPSIKLNIQLSGGLFSSFFSGEGLVIRLEGQGKIKLQTRSIGGLAGWLNPRFRG